jgi:integrase/recombinase XerD
MISTLYSSDHARAQHSAAPFLREREQYLAHLLRQGTSVGHLRSIAAKLLHVVCALDITNERTITFPEIQRAGEHWEQTKSEHRSIQPNRSKFVYRFTIAARDWLRFHGWLIEAPACTIPLNAYLEEFLSYLRFTRNLSSETVRGYGQRTRGFLAWLGNRHNNFSDITMNDIDSFIESRQAAGWNQRTIATQCQALRTFFGYAEIQGWCRFGFARGIRSPRIPKYEEAPTGPPWTEVRRLLRSVNGREPAELRDRTVLLLCSIYGLRRREVAELTIDDFDWRNETLTVRRAKRGRLQQYPIQYEVGETILRYLQKARPRCACRNLFLTRYPPYRPIQPSLLRAIVSRRMEQLGIQSQQMGPHSLRHACATQLLKKGTRLRDIADFLGHRDLKSVSIYAKYDLRTLREVAAFSLGGVL